MAKKESTQHKLDRVRAPRVHITYDVDIGDAIEKKELPFVVGVLGDFSGNPLEPLPKLKD
ncbi:type VI secretion system contractile sheath small subunit, partial [Escherichia coli]|nr:type VI secretion system contractile sheath small subunit [Escherichia coli]